MNKKFKSKDVFIVYTDGYEGFDVEGVFGSLDLAKEYIREDTENDLVGQIKKVPLIEKTNSIFRKELSDGYTSE